MTRGEEVEPKNSISHYTTIRPLYEKLVDEIVYALSDFTSQKGIEISEILGRAKTIDSLQAKISRKVYTLPLKEIKDLAGVRVICLFEADLEKVKDIVAKNFDVVEVENKSDSLGDSLMGYQGYHLTVRLGGNFRGPRYNRIQDLFCEIQVRTVLQDAWSKISHKLVYKSEASVPQPLRRSLNNVSSLMEIAQSVFDTIKVGQEKYIEELKRAIDDEDDLLGQEINHHTLTEYASYKFPKMTISEYWQDALISDLNLSRYKKIEDLDNLVSKALPLIEGFAKKSPYLFRHSTDYITKSLGLLDPEFLRKHNFAAEAREELSKIRELNRTG